MFLNEVTDVLLISSAGKIGQWNSKLCATGFVLMIVCVDPPCTVELQIILSSGSSCRAWSF